MNHGVDPMGCFEYKAKNFEDKVAVLTLLEENGVSERWSWSPAWENVFKPTMCSDTVLQEMPFLSKCRCNVSYEKICIHLDSTLF